jgi:hypothetical protein
MNNSLTENNYIYIPNFISEASAKVMSHNFKKYCKDNEILGDNQAPNSSAKYDFIDFLELLCEKSPVVSHIIGETVLPTYSYARVYKDGSVLERHRDRDACEISLTVHLDGDEEWPIYIETPTGEEVELILKPGDAMLYLGCVADHWRNQFLGREYVQVFLHYVRSRGDKSYAYFDKNKEKSKQEKNNDEKKPSSISKYKKNLNDYIIVLDNIIPHDLCDEILNEYTLTDEWKRAQVGYNEINETRNVDTIGISSSSIIEKNLEKRKIIDEKIFKVAGEAIKRYNIIFPNCQIEQDSGYDLLKYNVGQYYLQHTDSYKLHPRSVSCSFALNDDYDGGEFAFFDRELVYKLKKGSIIMFPSSFMYPHEIMPITKGTRYSIVTWFI